MKKEIMFGSLCVLLSLGAQAAPGGGGGSGSGGMRGGDGAAPHGIHQPGTGRQQPTPPAAPQAQERAAEQSAVQTGTAERTEAQERIRSEEAKGEGSRSGKTNQDRSREADEG